MLRNSSSDRRSGTDWAARRIAQLLEREERIAAEHRRLRDAGWRPAAADHPSDAAFAAMTPEDQLAEMFYRDSERRRRIDDEARRRVQAGLMAQAAPHTAAGGAPADSYDIDDLNAGLAFGSVAAWEKFEDKAYAGKDGVPTIGYGYALVVDGNNGWQRRSDDELARVGISLTAEELAKLEDIADHLNGVAPDQSQSWDKTLDAIRDLLPEAEIDEPTAQRAFFEIAPDFRRTVRRGLGADTTGQYRFDLLTPEQQAALMDFAYRRPAWFNPAGNTAPALQSAIDADRAAGNWKQTDAILNGLEKGNRRTPETARWFTTPGVDRLYRIQPNELLPRIVRNTGLSPERLVRLNPQVKDWSKLNSGQLLYVDPNPHKLNSGRVR